MKDYGSTRNVEQESEKEKIVDTTNFRRTASQCCGVLAANFLKFTANSIRGFQIILIAELYKDQSEITVTLDQLTWIASLNFLVPIGSIGSSFISQRLGNRLTMLAGSSLFVLVWLIFYNAHSMIMLIAGQVLYYLTNGALKTPTSNYISEISQPRLRGIFLASHHLAATFGAFFSLLLGCLLYWRTIALVNLICPVICFIMVLMIPESPIWLARIGRYSEAERALSWLRGWVQPNDVNCEYRCLIENSEKTSIQKKNLMNDQDQNSSPQAFKRHFVSYLHRSFYLPLATVSLINFIHFFSGVTSIQTYSGVIFEELRSPMETSKATALIGAMRVVGAFVVLASIQSLGKRRLTFLSLVVASCCYLVITSIGFLVQRGQASSEACRWLPSLALLLATFANAFGVEPTVLMLNSEIFPAPSRYLGSALGSSVASVAQSLMNKIFLYMLADLTPPGLFLYFCLVNVLAVFVYHRVFPETEGRSLQDIEDHYNGVRRLSSRMSDELNEGSGRGS